MAHGRSPSRCADQLDQMLRYFLTVSCFLLLAFSVNNSTAQSAISGIIVVGEQKSPVSGVKVELTTEFGTHSPGLAPTYSDAEGRFSFSRVNAGTWRLRITVGAVDLGYTLLTPKLESVGGPAFFDVRLAHRVSEQDIMLPTVVFGRQPIAGDIPAGKFNGAVVDADTFEPVGGASVILEEKESVSSKEPALDRKLQHETTDAFGNFQADLTHKKAVRLAIEKEGYAPLEVTHLSFGRPYAVKVYVRSLDSPLLSIDPRTFRIDKIFDSDGNDLGPLVKSTFGSPMGRLTGTVSIDGIPTPGVRIELLGEGFKPLHRFLDGLSEELGEYEIIAVEPGSYSIRISMGSHFYDIPRVDVGPGITNLDFTF